MSVNNKQWYGLPLNLIWGYVAIAVFMTGDGLSWLFCRTTSKHSDSTPAQASFASYSLRSGCRPVGVGLRRGGGNHYPT